MEIETTQPYHSNSGLYIFECIELELGVSLDDNADLFSSPICLYGDPYVPSRFETVLIIQRMEEFVSRVVLIKSGMRVAGIFVRTKPDCTLLFCQ